jgi:hypothetical protein
VENSSDEYSKTFSEEKLQMKENRNMLHHPIPE